MSVRERDIEAWLKGQVRDMGGLYLKFVSPGNDGVPDRIVIFPDGRLVFVELKTDGGKLSKVQRYQLNRLILMGQQVAVIRGMAGAEHFIRDMEKHVGSSCIYCETGSLLMKELLYGI